MQQRRRPFVGSSGVVGRQLEARYGVGLLENLLPRQHACF